MEDRSSQEEWFKDNWVIWIEPYIRNNFGEVSIENQKSFMFKYIYFTQKIIEDDELSNGSKIKVFLKNLVHSDKNEGKIVLVDGAMGGGKTGFGSFVIDEYHKTKPYLNYFFVTKSETKPQLPDWFKIIEDVNLIENNSVALVDEGAIQLSSRRSMTHENVEAAERLIKLRQKGITLIILVQNIKMVDINVRRLASIRVLKFGISFGDEQGDTSDDVKEIRKRLKPTQINEAYFEIQAYGIYLKFNHILPCWWDDEKVSKYMKHWTERKKEAPANTIMSIKPKRYTTLGGIS